VIKNGRRLCFDCQAPKSVFQCGWRNKLISNSMSPELEERIYKTVLRGVLWGTEREGIFEILQTNGISGDHAEAMYRRAWDERIAFIRGESIRRAIKGALLLAAGIGIFRFFWYGIGAITFRLYLIS
jgi:hypothetical protein